MRRKFKDASLSDLRLPVFLKEALWKTKAVNCKPAMDVLRGASQFYLRTEDEAEALKFVEEIVKAVDMTRAYANEFFAYRGGQVPDDLYYATIGRSLIRLSPESFPMVTENCRCLFDRVEKIHNEPDLYLSSQMDAPAKYAFAIEKYMQLDDLLFSMQSNIHLAGKETNARYNSTVLPVKKIMKGAGTLSRDMQLTGRKIDFIVNNLNEERFWYIQFASRNFDNICDKKFVFDYGGMPDVGGFREAFYQAYSRVEDRIGEQGINAFYEFAETVISPMNFFMSISDAISDKDVLYSFARLSMKEPSETETIMQAASLYPVADEFMEKLEIARHLCGFQHRTATLWGDKVNPYIFVQDLVDYEEVLRNLDDIYVRDSKLNTLLQASRDRGCAYYNPTARENAVLGFQPYYPSYQGPSPAND